MKNRSFDSKKTCNCSGTGGGESVHPFIGPDLTSNEAILVCDGDSVHAVAY